MDDGLGLARGAAGERDQARVLGVELDRRRRGLGRVERLVGDREDRAVRAGRRRARARLRSSARRSPPAARRRGAAAGPWRAAARCTAATTAPMRKHATIVRTHSGRLPISVITTSPRPDAVRGERARQRAPSARRPRRTTTRAGAPSRASSTSARRAGSAASTTSRAKFMRPGTLVVAVPRAARAGASREAGTAAAASGGSGPPGRPPRCARARARGTSRRARRFAPTATGMSWTAASSQCSCASRSSARRCDSMVVARRVRSRRAAWSSAGSVHRSSVRSASRA